MPAVSVIVPFYNAERTLARCLRSLFEQSFEDMEYVLVNDGSTDSSMQVIDSVVREYPERIPCVNVFQQESNSGVLKARMRGVQEAKGDYITFADADDTVSVECYGRLYEEAIRSRADMVRCGYVEIVDGHEQRGYFVLTPDSGRDRRIRDAIALKTDPYLMTKIVRGSIFKSPDFVWPVENIAEDWFMGVQFAFLADKVSVVDECFYHYYISGPSISHVQTTDSRYMARIQSEKKNIEALECLLTQRGLSEEYHSELNARKISVKRLLFPLLGDRLMRIEWRKTFSEINWSILINRYVPTEYKFKHLCAMFGVYTPLYSLYLRLTGR